MRRRAEPLEDLVQVANIGLLEALDRFDPSFGVTFRTFASATVTGVLRRHYRNSWRLRVPRGLQELHLSVSRAIETLTVDLRRSPTVREVAAHIGASEDAVVEAIGAGSNFWPLSLTYSVDGEPLNGTPLTQHDDLERVDATIDVHTLLESLPERERTVLKMSYFENRTQSDIAEHLGLSQVHVSRIMRAALTSLRSRA
jgi:RNA polymerase sigma-B factor